ncbi:glycosyltransferase 87 family protein [Anaeromyxobacter diazotrophicus]|uniref:DUF2029 domain-containing protein n=1 Tax=Anaeromyxobacter diazotrophicus TaxID=2590199 RepID=A0A7I9VKX0_9BACT|nr:glycosyltransferase 87 family protein [Anaeromyxobacter diazotrophicus]GEJ57041.1 hypothetical protein AMYX_17820 [Anaeromyxobacter diazotrophicus]
MTARGAPAGARAQDRGGPERRGPWWAPPAIGLGLYVPAAVLLVAVLGFAGLWYGLFDISDIPLYHSYATAMDRGLRPFLDFPAEYPPLALRLFAYPGHPAELEAYAACFFLLMLLALAVGAVVTAAAAARLWAGQRRVATVAATYGLSVLALGAVVANRFDAVVATLLACALWATVSRRWVLAGLALGLGTALKLTPLILLPAAALFAADRRSRAALLGAFAVAALGPFAVEGPSTAWAAVLRVFEFHGARPVQLESALGTPLLLAHLAGLQPARVGRAFGSEFIDARGAGLLARASGPLALALLLGTYGLVWRRRAELRASPRRLALVALAALLAFLVPAKVLSPQFLVWLLPAVALAAPEAPGLAAWLVVVLFLTQLEFPSRYLELVALRPATVLLVAARNAGLAVALVWVLVRLAQPRTPSPEVP